MKVSEITESVLESYLRIEEDSELLPEMKQAAVAYVKSYTGLDEEALDRIPEMWIAVACLVSDMYDNRSMNVKEEGINRTAACILGMHSINLL